MRILLRVISLIVGAALLPGIARAVPPVAQVDAVARASGNAKDVAARIGRSIFEVEWPAQVIHVYADRVGSRRVAGLKVSGTHFHRALTRVAFTGEVAELVQRAFAAAPIEEVDVWVVVPLSVGKGVVVSGDYAKPTSRTVFTISVRRSEAAASVLARERSGQGVFWDQEWARAALK